MLMSKYHSISGHTRVVDSLSTELVKLGHKVTLGSFKFEKEPPEKISKLQLHKSDITKKIKDSINNTPSSNLYSDFQYILN